MAIEIVDFPMKNGDFPSFFVSLPGRVNSSHWDLHRLSIHGAVLRRVHLPRAIGADAPTRPVFQNRKGSSWPVAWVLYGE